ncbi:cyclin-K [Microdochium trichocladiopsis]|uniref:RNA polymerase II holoenzyme cyclin-like subunit n=1 Tax=Microdochium trichocladiopsis TaxID=1682393 RepID=A0A9P8YIL0_9PEZI|nr:cyclin-K [Microdochium trichocladiopsis]KAH7039685.1 cyclin-K [Microdochium trichocladiopsis]
MASIDRYRPTGGRESYQPPVAGLSGNRIKSPTKRREIPPAVPSPPTFSSRNSPPHSQSRTTASSSQSTPRTPVASRNQWLFTPEEILSSPSVLDGISPAEERLRRAKGVNFIYQVGVLLELPQTTLYVAGVFFHRFYMRSSLVEEKHGVHHYNIAATALFLANKIEENCRKTKDVIINIAKVAQKNSKLIVDEQSKEYWRWRDSILMYEEVMLENLTFDLMIENPHIKLYETLGHLGVIHNKALRHAAWAFCNDSCLTSLPLLMEARDIAIAAIFFSATFTGEQIPDIHERSWWKAINANEDHCAKAIETVAEFYKENPLRKTDNPYNGASDFSLENTRRRLDDSSNGVTPRTENGTQSPQVRANGADQKEMEIEAEKASQKAPGDSDAALKEAANDPTIHQSTSAGSMGSPRSKRKEFEAMDTDDRDSKRQKTESEDDEGEVHE